MSTRTLRPNRSSDADAITAACQDPEIQRWSLVLPNPYRREDAVTWIERSVGDAQEGRSYAFVAVDAGGEVAGALSVFGGEIGYWVAPQARRRGVATRAVTLLRDWAHETLGHERLFMTIHPDNAVSRRVAERVGFVDTGQRRIPDRGQDPDPHAIYVWTAA